MIFLFEAEIGCSFAENKINVWKIQDGSQDIGHVKTLLSKQQFLI